MKNEMKIDEDYIPCTVTDEDELYRNGIFVFNISRIMEYMQKNPDKFHPAEVDVSEFFGEHSRINESHVESVDVSKPVILAEIAPGRYNLIDGNHRMEKARRLGIDKVQAYRLNVNQHLQFLTSKTAYEAYVGYWNSKLEE